MKNVGIFIDFLIHPNQASYILEQIIGICDDITIYTLVHNQGEFKAPIELQKIKSTFLSPLIKNDTSLKKYYPLIWNARNQVVLDINHDYYVFLNSGHLTGINIPKGKIKINFQLGSSLINKEMRKFKILFSTFYDSKFKNDYNNPSFSLKLTRDENSSKILKIIPPIDFTSLTIEEKISFKQIILIKDNIDIGVIDFLNDFSKESGINLKMFSSFELTQLDPQNRNQILNESYLVIDLRVKEFPDFALKALACGVNAIVSKEFEKHLNEYPINFIKICQNGKKVECLSSFKELIQNIILNRFLIDRSELRRAALKLNARNFKRKFLKDCQELYSELQSLNEPIVKADKGLNEEHINH